jgi:hypothetical protein
MHAFGIIIGIVLMVCFEIFVLAPFRPVVETTSFTTSFVFQNRVIPVTCHGAYMHSFDEYSLYVWGSTNIGLTGGYIRTLRIGDTLMERDEHVWGHFDKDGAHAPDVRHLVATACGAHLFTH